VWKGLLAEGESAEERVRREPGADVGVAGFLEGAGYGTFFGVGAHLFATFEGCDAGA
jgi:hypothetical protein